MNQIDIEALMERMAPPHLPAGALELDPTLEPSIRKFDRLQLTLALSGLQTDATFQANNVRLEWATRLALALGRGHKRPSRDELGRLLNEKLRKARVTRLEDPIEDVLIEPICTRKGEFLIFTGIWEKAGHFTESVLTAFSLLPEGEPKTEALAQTYALLRVSDALVRRASLGRYTVGSGLPNGTLKLPPSKRLAELQRRVVFTWSDLSDADISVGDLAPFIFDPDRLGSLLERAPGDSLLEFHPLLLAEDGVVVAAPSNLSTAIRTRLIDAAIAGGMEELLRRNLLAVQSKLIDDGGLVHIRGPIVPFANGFGREHIEEMSLGRYLHVLHAIEDFGDWPDGAFAMSGDASPEFAKKIATSVSAARAFAAERDGFISGLSLIFLSGWGSGHALKVEWPELRGWQVIFLEPHDGFILGGCNDGSVQDLAWMRLQLDHVQQQGFEFQHVNGFLNLFQWWRNTEHAFVPPRLIDAQPPLFINFDSDLLLEARREALLAWDRRSVPTLSGHHATVMRINPKTLFESLEPVYGSYDAARAGKIIAALLLNDWFPIWFELDHRISDPNSHDAHETFKAMLSWAVRILPPMLSGNITADMQPIRLCLKVEWPEEALRATPWVSDLEIEGAIHTEVDYRKREALVELTPTWQFGLQRADNYAEAALAAAVLSCAAQLLGSELPTDGIGLVRSILGSTDARWRHMIEVRSVIEALKAHGLVAPFAAIPSSIAALVRTDVAWATHPRELGPVIEGKEACRAFLDDQVKLLLTSLRACLKEFRRDDLVRAVLSGMHAAQADERQWYMSARALRAIHGKENDYAVSLKRRAEINAVLRASTMLAEIGLVDCPPFEGRGVGTMDLAELQALAILLFQTADLIPAIEGGRIRPRFNISPTGDMLHDHGFEETTIQRSGKITHEAQRDEAVRDYMHRIESDAEPPLKSSDLELAIEAEYGVDLDNFVTLAQFCADLGVKRGEGIFQIPRSELIEQLSSQIGPSAGVETLVDRLTLRSRADWTQVPPGASTRDFDLAKLDRRYSLVGRPLLALDAGDDPSLIIAPGIIERCILHSLQGVLHGALQNEFWSSEAMRRFAGERGRIEGMRFNEKVAEALRALGLAAYSSAKPSWCFNHKNTAEVAALGDFDVLAVTPDGMRIWIVEAKDLKLCRTIGETARRLAEYEGRTLSSGKPDKMMRHLRRVAYAREHAHDLRKRLELDCTPEIVGIMVVRAPQPMEAISLERDNDARAVMLANLPEVPWCTGWRG